MSTLSCPAPSCTRTRRSVTELLCPRCWYRVPKNLRSEVWRAWRQYNDGTIDLPALRAVQDAAIKAIS